LVNDDIPTVAETKKRYENALPLFIEASQLRPDSAEAYYHIACIHARQGRIPESIKYLDLAIQKGFHRWDIIETDSDLENIRGYDGYQLLVKG
jgi:tetratricopeptide (TPR) repeat protein